MAVQVVDGTVEVGQGLVAKESLVVKESLVELKGCLEGCQEHQEGHGKLQA